MERGIPDSDKWKRMSLREQMANIGSEVGRTNKWIKKDKSAMAESAFYRALDLIDITIKYGRLNSDNRDCMLKEMCRMREVFCQSYFEKDLETLDFLDKYFSHFATAQRRHIA